MTANLVKHIPSNLGGVRDSYYSETHSILLGGVHDSYYSETHSI